MPNWSLIEMPQVEITSPEQISLKALPAIFSLSSDGWIEGELVSDGTIKILESFNVDKYTIRDTGFEVAHIISSDVGAAMQPLPFGALTSPCVIVESSENSVIKQLLEKHESVEVKLNNQTETKGTLETIIIYSTKEFSNKVPLICAHYDTVYNNMGAHDNASGVAVLMELLANHGDKFKFAFFDAEECNKVGSTAFVEMLKLSGSLDSISYVLEIDAVGTGEEIALLASKKSYKPLKRIELNNIELGEHRINLSQQTKIGFSDVFPFMNEGVPVIRMLTRGQVANAITHFPEDTIDKIDVSTLSNAYNVAEYILQNLEF
jgi:Iap family predicted aminopeptidase